jgi:hypothetical protein
MRASENPQALLFYDCFGKLEAGIVSLLSGSLILLGVPRDEVGYQIVDSVRDAIHGHGCVAAPGSRRMQNPGSFVYRVISVVIGSSICDNVKLAKSDAG